MKKIAVLLLLAALQFLTNTTTQAQHECGSDLLHHYKMSNDPIYAQDFLKRQEDIREIQMSRSGGGDVYQIPVVFHVIHLGEVVGVGSNISDEQILNSLQSVNDRFANLNGMGASVNMQFCLATQDPDGCPTNGIIRVDGSVLPNYAALGVDYPDGVECGAAPDEDVKALSTWPVLDYYNIWVVHSICEGWAGYAYYPNGQDYDGTIIRYDYTTSSSTTLTHELGHAFNLAHTFNGDNGNTECPPDNDCTVDGDFVCDTPPHKQSDCSAINTCTAEGVWDNSRKNYMSYCGATDRFTAGQKDRMEATLLTFPRANLLNSSGCAPSTFSTVVSIENIHCVGACTGSLSVAPACSGLYTYTWATGESTPEITGLCPGIYSVLITNEFGQTHEVAFELLPADPFEITINPIYTICYGDDVQLEVVGGDTYVWSPVDGLSGADISDPLAQPEESTTYLIVGTSENGCIDSTEVTVNVLDLTVVEIIQVADTLFATPEGLTYEWYFNGNELKGQNGEYIIAAEDGLYSVFATDENNCTSVVFDFNYVGTEEIEFLQPINLYPNPGSGIFTLEAPDWFQGNTHFELFDDTCRLVYSIDKMSSADQQITFDFSGFSAGMYVFKISNEIGTGEQRITILK